MATWERIANGVKKELSKTHRLDLNGEGKCARFYRIMYFNRGPLPFAPYEGKEEILIDGNEGKAIVKNLGFDYYRLNNAMREALIKLGIGCLVNESPDRTEYTWKRD